MTYSWKINGLYPVPAQQAGEELERIYEKRGKMDAADIVDESRPEDAVLHKCFEWDDFRAAELYRADQARGICRCIVTVIEPVESAPIEVRPFVHAADTYRPIHVVIENDDMYEELAKTALREFQACAKKHAALSNRRELQAIFEAIDFVSKSTFLMPVELDEDERRTT